MSNQNCKANFDSTAVEWIGYICRAVSHTQAPNYTLIPYVIQSILLLVAPALFAASIYMELGRIIRMVDGEALSLIKTKRMTLIFVLGDVLTFLIQSSGTQKTSTPISLP